MAELERAAYEVERYENYIQVLLSVHKDCGPKVDWRSMASAEEPKEPVRLSAAEDEALRVQGNYKPTIVDRMLKREESKRSELATEVERARQVDNATYRKALDAWDEELKDWKESQDLAKRVLALDPQALLDAVSSIGPFAEIKELGSGIKFEMGETGIPEAVVSVHPNSVIPSESKSLLQSGRLSTKQMPKGRFNALFQDYVCSCVLRIANELLAIVPAEAVIVTALDELLDTATGHLEEVPIVSAYVPRVSLERLNLDLIDPSDSMENFVCRMSFKKTKGFGRVDRLDPNDFSTSLEQSDEGQRTHG